MKMKMLGPAVLACVIALLLTNLVITARLAHEIEGLKPEMQRCRSLPCEAIPIRFARDSHDCANRLLRAMNVTNVRFLSSGYLQEMRQNLSHLTDLQ